MIKVLLKDGTSHEIKDAEFWNSEAGYVRLGKFGPLPTGPVGANVQMPILELAAFPEDFVAAVFRGPDVE